MGVTWILAMVLAQTLPPARDAGIDGPLARPSTRVAQESRGLPASVDVRSQLGKRFRLVEVDVVMDGETLSHREAAPGQELERAFRAYDGTVTPGPHSITVTLVYQGRNVGPFTYLGQYRYRVTGTADFAAHAGGLPAAIDVIAAERPGATVSVEDKPTLDIRSAPNSSVVPVLAGGAAAGVSRR
jgi:hypothetical protein